MHADPAWPSRGRLPGTALARMTASLDVAVAHLLGFLFEDDGAEFAIVLRRKPGSDLAGALEEGGLRQAILVHADVLQQRAAITVEHPHNAALEYRIVEAVFAGGGRRVDHGARAQGHGNRDHSHRG